MHEAQLALAPDGQSAPWNALFKVRREYGAGVARECFEAGYLIRFFQLLQEARHGVPHWSLGKCFITPSVRYRRSPE
ncbi:hypothetical protein [Pseudomonas sp. SCB32]|uniref:hypothetical protein n=1 Tax=Pseudomonas sp. SCB32 TaxID=2653853 RepID=UPI0012659955|nr:hypothetical protein [Pseudomonas sp. SCB32]